MNYIIAVLFIESTLALGVPDMVVPVPEESFATLQECHERRKMLVYVYEVEDPERVLCLSRTTFTAGLPEE